MKGLELLLNRRSQPRLSAPAPQGEALENIMQAALRAPDHACLTPWKFVVCEKAGLDKLGEIFEQAAVNADMDQKQIARATELPKRAPMIIVAIAKYQEHEKVPWVEQVASCACAVQAMQMAAVAQGFAGIWRTGSYAQNEDVKNAFELQENDEILGFLYLGTSAIKTPSPPKRESSDYFSFWN